MFRIVKSAFKGAKAKGKSPLTALLWAAEDLRSHGLETAFDAGVPPLLLAPVTDLPGLLGRAEYACKSQWHEFILHGAIGDLLWQMNYEAERDWD